MNYQQTKDYLEEYASLGSKPGLDSIRMLCERLGNPQDALNFIHIAGTNGKGSVSAFTAGILRKAGFHVGRYTSPAVFAYEERFEYDGKPIGKTTLAKIFSEVAKASDAMEAEGFLHPTVFEMETAAAFLFFREKKADAVVLECGMGGLLDATNIIAAPRVCVFTSISRDHMAYLGNTVEEIAGQKAGILKAGAVAVSAPQEECVRKVLQEAARKMGCPFIRVDADFIGKVQCGERTTRFDYGPYKNLSISLRGTWQPENAATALEAALAFLNCVGKRPGKRKTAEEDFREECIRKGLRETVWPGRFETVGKHPLFLIDGAHNEGAALRLRDSVANYFTNREIIYIMGMLKDKETERVAEIMAPLAAKIITVTPPSNPRAMQAYDLAMTVRTFHPCVSTADSVEEAVELATLLAGPEGVILAFGSLSYLGKIKETLAGKEAGKW